MNRNRCYEFPRNRRAWLLAAYLACGYAIVVSLGFLVAVAMQLSMHDSWIALIVGNSIYLAQYVILIGMFGFICLTDWSDGIVKDWCWIGGVFVLIAIHVGIVIGTLALVPWF